MWYIYIFSLFVFLNLDFSSFVEELQKRRLAEQEKETGCRKRDDTDQDELDFEGLDLLMQSGLPTSPDQLLATSLLEIKEEPKLSPDESPASKEADEQIAKQEDSLGILSEITDTVSPSIVNGSEP